MSCTWPLTPLRNLIELDLDMVRVDPSESYPMVGVYSFGRGLFLREPVEGNNTSYRFFYRLKANHIVMSQLFGWEGALALSSKEFEGLFVSPQFPTFLSKADILDRHFLGWFMRRPQFWEQLSSKTSGMGDRRRTLNPEALLSCSIPLPPLPEQRRIVARIEKLDEKIREIQRLIHLVSEEVDDLIASLHIEKAAGKIFPLGSLVGLEEDREPVDSEREYPQVGIRSFGEGIFGKPAVRGSETTYRHFNRIYPGALLLSQVKGWEGAIAVCPKDMANRYASPEYRTFRCNTDMVLPEYLSVLVTTPWFLKHLTGLSRGVGARRERTRPEHFLALEIPMPAVGEQRDLLDVFGKISRVQELGIGREEEVTAFMPSALNKIFRGKS